MRWACAGTLNATAAITAAAQMNLTGLDKNRFEKIACTDIREALVNPSVVRSTLADILCHAGVPTRCAFAHRVDALQFNYCLEV